MSVLIEPFSVRFMQIALADVALLAVAGGLLGTQIVLRRLAFFSHGVGSAAFPGLVVAGPIGIPPQLAALVVGIAFAGGLERLSRAARLGYDAATALLLVAALGVGVVLASDVFEAGASVDQLLFGTLLGLGYDELAISAATVGLIALLTLAFGRSWTATSFDEASARSLGVRVVVADWALVLLIAVAVVAAIDAVGALLVSAILVIPATTARLLAGSVRSLRLGALALALLEGVAGLWLAYTLDVPPGPAIALLGGGVFALTALASWGYRRSRSQAARVGSGTELVEA